MKRSVNFKEISKHETPGRSPGFLLWHISISWRSSIEATLKPLGLTHPQFVVLTTLGWLTRGGDLITQRALGTVAGLDPNTLSQVLKGLEKKGLVQREPSSDGRAKNPSLTQEGGRVVAQALPAVEGADAHFFAPLNKEEMGHLIEAFQKLCPTP